MVLVLATSTCSTAVYHGTAVVAQLHGSSRRSQPSVAATTTPLAKRENYSKEELLAVFDLFLEPLHINIHVCISIGF